MSRTSAKKKVPRVQPKEVRREQLIKATMKCIARSGLSGTTVAEVTREAGLSLGIANLHFESKDKLLTETLLHVSREYHQGQRAILEGTRFASTAEKIEALLQFDFSPKVANKDKIAVWFAFWGEAKSRPTYQAICREMDLAAEGSLSRIFGEAIEESGYQGLDPIMLAAGYIALSNGLWLNMLLARRHPKRSHARQIARNYLASALPDHVAKVEPV